MDNAPENGKLKGLLWILATAGIALATLVALPLLAKSVPWNYEKKLSDALKTASQFTECKKPEARTNLKILLTRLHPLPSDEVFPIEVTIIHGNTVNAFASLGGEIFVYEGLLKKANSPEELAGVLAHEIEHVKRRHIIQGVFLRLLTLGAVSVVINPQSGIDPRLISMLMNLRFSREQENEADVGGLKRLQEAHVDARGFADFFKHEETTQLMPAFLSDHPASGNRAELAKKYFRMDTIPILTQSEWVNLKSICETQ